MTHPEASLQTDGNRHTGVQKVLRESDPQIWLMADQPMNGGGGQGPHRQPEITATEIVQPKSVSCTDSTSGLPNEPQQQL